MNSIALEGIQCSGKTLLISLLKAKLKKVGGFDVKELAHVDTDDQYSRYLREYATQERVLLHRSHISEHVLGGILRERSPFSDGELASLNACLSLRFTCVLAEPPDFDSFSNRILSDAGHTRLGFKEDQYTQIVASFRNAFSTIPHVHYVSSSFDSLESAVEAVMAKLRNRQELG